MTYHLLRLDSFELGLRSYIPKDQIRLTEKAEQMLSQYPRRYPTLKGPIEINGVYFFGLRKFKSGLSGRKGGAYILYRICEECKENGYNEKIKCEFCDGEKNKHIVLFITKPRSLGYKTQV